MRKIATIATTIMLILALSASAAFAATIVGHPWAETLKGTAQSDTISGKGGGDALLGFGGDDFLYGGAGHDALYGGPGNDKIYGGAGADLIVSEGDSKADTVDCGPGFDVVKKSPTEQIDTFVGCERFVR